MNSAGKAKENDDNSGEFKLPLVWIDLEMTGNYWLMTREFGLVLKDTY